MKKQCDFCHTEYEAARQDSKYCSKKCRVYAGRISATGNKRNTGATPISATYTLVPDVTVYGRPAVQYPLDRFRTRPMPLDPEDRPDPLNRCIFNRGQDRYIIDCTGHAFKKQEDWQHATPYD